MQASIILSGVTFLCAFPLSAVVELYSSFGVFNQKGIFSKILNGLFIAIAFFGGLNIIVNQSHWLRLGSVKLYALLIAFISTIVLLNFDEQGYVGLLSKSAGAYHIPLLFDYLVYCILGTHLLHLRSFRYSFLISLMIAGYVTLTFVDFNTLRLDITGYVDKDLVGNYQFIGDTLAITSLMVIALFGNSLFRIALFAGTAIVLFLVGSRTSFAVFAFTGLIFMVLSFRVWWIILLGIVFLVAGFSYGNSISLAELERLNPRMVQIFTEYEDDSSIIGRKDRDDKGWEDISAHPIKGRFGGQRDIEGWNAYMHNVFSYWRQFGAFPFGIVVVLYLFFFLICLLRFRQKSNDYYTVPFLLGLFLLVESIISRSYAFGYLHLTFGVLIAFHAWYKYGDYFTVADARRRTHRPRRRRKRTKTNQQQIA